MTADVLPWIKRPNGKTYQPRKLTAFAVTDYHGDELEGVVVFGSHEISERVQALAESYVAWQIDSSYAPADPMPVWWRDGFDNGARGWLDDPERGRAGVWFRKIVETTR